jgi:hypothetical protein
MFQFDAQFERTCFPTELLWGTGTPRDAHAWCVRESPGKGSVRYRARLFALRIDQGRVSLPRRPEVALAIPPERRAGRWLVVRSDFASLAFAHARHIKDGVASRDTSPTVRHLGNGVTVTSPPISECAAETVIDGEWDQLVNRLAVEFRVKDRAELVVVRVPPRWGVAQDVEAE